MSAFPKRTMVTLAPEWFPMLDQLKKEKFYNDTQAEMFRYIIGRGLKVIKDEAETSKNDHSEDPIHHEIGIPDL